MKKNSLHNKNAISNKKKKHYYIKKDENAFLRKEVDAFLMTSGVSAIYKLTSAISKLKIPLHNAKEVIKYAICEEIKRYNNEASESGVTIKNRHSTMLMNLDTTNFIAREWQYVPFILKNRDYLELQTTPKFPIFIENYDYSLPLYEFKNNIKFNNEINFQRKNVITSNDVQFYISNDEKVLFSKVTNLLFSPISYKLIKEFKKTLSPNDNVEQIKYMPSLYERSFSISMYVILEGDTKKTHMYMRYDSSSKTHKNIYIGNDKRENIFGYEAENPHFHFQNEDDNLLCIKKFRDGYRQIKWKTGRCNAIDLKHLINYLTELDSFTREKVEKLYFDDMHYNMPFLKAKFNNQPFCTKSINTMLLNYKNEKGSIDEEYIKKIKDKFEILNQRIYNNSKNKVFKNLITSLKFLQFICDERVNTKNLNELENLSKLEIIVASDIMNAINCSQEKVIEKDYQPKYIINGDYLLSKQKKNQPKEHNEDNQKQ